MASSVDGLVSGLDTTTIITQLMQLERQPQQRLQAKKTVAENAVKAYQQINTKMAALRDAARGLSGRDDWKITKATSSLTDAVGVAATTGASTGSLTFTVDRLAAAASRASSGTVASLTTVVAAGPVTIVKDGVTTNIDVGDGQLATVVQKINESTAGVKAAAVQVAPNTYKLQLTSTTTGASSAFTVSPAFTGLGSMDALLTGQDAQIRVGGAAPGAYTVTSSTNTMTYVLPGVTLTLKKADPAVNVTVNVATDVDGLADRASKIVDAANAAITDIRALSAAGKDGNAGGPLSADSIVRRLEQEVLSAVGSGRFDGTTPALAGIEVTRTGTLTFTRSKFLDSYAANPTQVADLFQEKATTSDSNLRFVSAGPTTASGDYGVVFDATALAAVATGQVVNGGGALQDPETIRIRSGSLTAEYNAAGGEDINDVATGLQAAFTSAGMSLAATVESGALVVRSTATGSAATFTVEAAGAGNKQTNLPLGTQTGADGSGHFTLADGTVVTGTVVGRFLNASGSGPLAGVSVEITGPFTSGSIGYSPGLARRLERVAELAIDSSSGALKMASDGKQSLVKDLTTRISAWDTRLALKETALRRQFSALEVSLGRLRDQSSWLSSQLGSLPSTSA